MKNKVIVITGASAGVGRAVAEEAARRGAAIALLARDEEALLALRDELRAMGARAEAYPLDVADADAVFAAAEDCEKQLGPIDIWINNAMATVFGRVADLDPEEVRRVTEVTYLGTVHGAMAAVRQMQPRQRGTIVQVGSALAYRGIPLQAAYCGAKHAVQGFTESLRTELLHDGSGIEVTSVHLPAINTPQFDWARTKASKAPRPVAPVFDPAVAARAILKAAARPSREYWLGGSTVMTVLGSFISPEFMDWFLARETVDGQERDRDIRPNRQDNLVTPVSGLHRTRGAFGDEAQANAVLYPASLTILGAAAGGLLAAGLIGAALARRKF